MSPPQRPGSSRTAIHPLNLIHRVPLLNVPFARARVSRTGPRTACAGLCLALALTAVPGTAQEALRQSLAAAEAAEARKLRLDRQPYTFKQGDFRLLLSPGLGMDFNDNIDLRETGGREDLILRPTLRATASHPLTEYNLLFVDVGFGYDQYLKHAEYSQWRLNSGSQVAFDVVVGDFWITLHDRFSCTQDSAREPTVAATGAYGVFENLAGGSVRWDLNEVTVVAGYDHQTWISLTEEFSYQDRAGELGFARGGFQLQPGLEAGVEGTVGFTHYQERYLNDSLSGSVGAYADWRPGTAFRIQPRAGTVTYQFRQTSDVIEAADARGWYMNLSVAHDLTETFSYTLTGGRQFRLGVQSDLVDPWQARLAVQWRGLGSIVFNAHVGGEWGEQSFQTAPGQRSEDYHWLTAGVGAEWPLMRRFALGLHYRANGRTSDLENRSYLQNVIGLSLRYTGR